MSPSTTDSSGGFRPNVDINLWCGKDADFSKLSVSKGTFLAHSIQSSYNKVHADAADDDSTLEQVTFHAVSPKKQSSMLQGKPKPPPPPPPTRFTPGLNGYWGCRFCPTDDDVDFLGLAAAASGSAMKAWEAELLVALQEGPFEFFRKIEKCDIILLPSAITEEADEADYGISKPCGMRGGCEGVTVEE